MELVEVISECQQREHEFELLFDEEIIFSASSPHCDLFLFPMYWLLEMLCPCLETILHSLCKVSSCLTEMSSLSHVLQLKKIHTNTVRLSLSVFVHLLYRIFRAVMYLSFQSLSIWLSSHQINMVIISRYTISTYFLVLDLPVFMSK